MRPDAEQFVQLSPQCTSLLQLAQTPALQYLPTPQSSSIEQSLQKPFSQP